MTARNTSLVKQKDIGGSNMNVQEVIAFLSDLEPSSTVLFEIDDAASYSIDQVEVKAGLVIFRSID